MLRRYQDEIEADLQRYYNLHLGLFGTRRLTLRRMIVLLKHLPPDSALVRGIRDDAMNDTAGDDPTEMMVPGDWALTDQLLGSIFDALQWANWQRGGGKGSRPKSIMDAAKRIRPAADPRARDLLSRGAPQRG